MVHGIPWIPRTEAAWADWVHTGIVIGGRDGAFDTIEANTNDEGSRAGYEVCQRVRGYPGKDLIVV